MISYLTDPTVQHQSLLAAMLLIVIFLVPATLGLWFQWDRVASIVTASLVLGVLVFSGTYYATNRDTWNAAAQELNTSYDKQLAPYGITAPDDLDISAKLRTDPTFTATVNRHGKPTEVVFTRSGNWIKLTDQNGVTLERTAEQA